MNSLLVNLMDISYTTVQSGYMYEHVYKISLNKHIRYKVMLRTDHYQLHIVG